MKDLTKTRIKIICIIIIIIGLFVGGLFAYKQWFVKHSAKITVKITDVHSLDDGYGYQYGIELYSIDDDYYVFLDAMGLGDTKTSIRPGYQLGTFQYDEKFDVGELVKGYIKNRGNTQNTDFIPE